MPPKRKPNGNLAAEVEKLRSQLGNLNARLSQPQRGRRSGRSRSRSRSRSRGGGPRNALPAASTSNASNRTSFGSVRTGVVIRGHEMVRAVKVPANKSSMTDYIDCNPGNTSLGEELTAMAKLFTQYRPVSVVIEYEPMCGTTTNGSFTIGVQPWNSESLLTTYARIAICQPNASGNVFIRHKVTVPAAFLKQKNWYKVDAASTDDAENPVAIGWWVDCDSSTSERTLGRVWIRYEYEFQGFRKPA